MGKSPLEECIPELKKQVEAAAARISEYNKQEKELEEKKNRVQERLAALLKRIEEFSGGAK